MIFKLTSRAALTHTHTPTAQGIARRLNEHLHARPAYAKNKRLTLRSFAVLVLCVATINMLHVSAHARKRPHAYGDAGRVVVSSAVSVQPAPPVTYRRMRVKCAKSIKTSLDGLALGEPSNDESIR